MVVFLGIFLTNVPAFFAAVSIAVASLFVAVSIVYKQTDTRAVPKSDSGSSRSGPSFAISVAFFYRGVFNTSSGAFYSASGRTLTFTSV